MQIIRNNKPIRVPRSILIVARYAIHIICWYLLVSTLYGGINGSLDGDPVQYLLDFTGIGTINLLFLSLTISPLAQLFKFGQLIVVRKTLGVYSAIYALAHLGVFIAFELQFEWQLIVREIIDRPYITVGFIALIILTSLLLTSFSSVKKRMGKHWASLHKWVYIALALGLLHYMWSTKANEIQAILYVFIGIFLLYIRKNKIRNFFK